MQILTLLERSRAFKERLFGTISATGTDLPSRICAAYTGKKPLNSATATIPRAATVPGVARTTEELLAELNSIEDPCDQTLWWRAHHQEISQAQRREARSRVQSSAKDEERFMGMIMRKQQK